MRHAKLDTLRLASLVVLAPLWLFPRGILPWLGLALVLGVAAWRLRVQQRARGLLEDVPLVFLVLAALFGLAISIERTLSAPRFWALLFGLVVFWTLRAALDVTRHARWAGLGLALGGLGLAAISLLGTDWSNLRFVALPWLYEALPSLIRGVPGSGVAQTSDLFNPRWVGMTMATLAPACLALVGWRRLGWLRALGALAFLVLTFTLLLTQSVQGLLGWAVGVFIVLVFASPWFWLLLPAASLAVIGMALQVDWSQAGQALLSLDHPAGIALILRLDIWRQAWAMLGDFPFTGIGLNTFQQILHEFYPGYLIGPEPHAHNLFLQTALDLGLPGLAALVWFLTAWAWRGLGKAARVPTDQRLLLVGALAGVAAYLASGLIDAMMLGAKPGFVVWALLGIGAAVTAVENTSVPGTSHKQRWVPWTAVLALPLLVGAAVLLFPGKAALNLGALQAVHALHPFPGDLSVTDMMLAQQAKANLGQALVHDPDAGQAHLLLARLAAALGDFEAALAHYAARVALDVRYPVERYNLTLAAGEWLGLENRAEPARELMKIYQAWVTRFPQRADSYVLKSILHGAYLGDVQGAKNILQAGMQMQALPAGLLEAALR